MAKPVVVLHFYQPIIQGRKILERITEESYKKICKVAKKYPQRIYADINLLKQIAVADSNEKLKNIVDCIERNTERVSTLEYHPLAPRLSQYFPEAIEKLKNINQEVYGRSSYFRFPECAFSAKDLDLLKEPKIVLSAGWREKEKVVWRGDGAVKYKNHRIVFIDNLISGIIAFSKPTPEKLEKILEKNPYRYALIHLDAETFGHHIKSNLKVLEYLARNAAVEGIEELASSYEEVKTVPLNSWAAPGGVSDPLALWINPKTEEYWKKYESAMKILKNIEDRQLYTEKYLEFLENNKKNSRIKRVYKILAAQPEEEVFWHIVGAVSLSCIPWQLTGTFYADGEFLEAGFLLLEGVKEAYRKYKSL